MEINSVFLPCYQVKVAGHVVNNTNNREAAHSQVNNANAKPAELWQINQNGSATLLHVSR